MFSRKDKLPSHASALPPCARISLTTASPERAWFSPIESLARTVRLAGTDFRHHTGTDRRPEIMDKHCGTLRGQPLGGRGTDPMLRPRYNRDFTF